tara:strand:- start:2440 stop:5088 length:2649 start_codon:yes stop_codon:yes gene_type:complete
MADETTEQRIAQIIAKQNEALQDQIKKETELAALRGESLDRLSQERVALQKQIDLDAERLKNLLEASKLSEKQRQDRLEALENEIQLLENTEKRTAEQEKQLQLKQEELNESKEILKASNKELKNQIEKLSIEREKAKLRDKALESTQNLAEATEELLASVTGISSAWKSGSSFSERILQNIVDSRKAGRSFSDVIGDIANKFNAAAVLQNAGASLILKTISATKELMFEMDNSLAAFKRATGLNGEYTESIVNVQQEMAALGASTADITKGFGDLAAANTTFVFESAATQESLMKTATAMEASFNAGEEFAGSMGFLQTTLGKTAEAAEQSSMDIVAAAQAMRIPPQQMLDDFMKLGPELAAWGPNTEKVFLETAAAAKALNMQTSEMLSIAEGFDTFASAADKVGQLNAALGGDYFDTMEMVMATEAERVEMLMSGIEASGKSFETMGRFEQKRIAAAAGVTVEQLGKMTNANRDLYTEMQNLQKDATMTYNDLTDAARENMGIQEKLAALQKALAVALKPLIDALNTVLGYIQEFAIAFPTLFKFISFGIGLFAFLGVTLLTVVAPATTVAANLGLVGKASATAGAAAATSSISMSKLGLVMSSLAKSLTKAAPGMLAFGAAALMVGGGIALAALGVANLVESFSTLGENTEAMNAALKAIFITMTLMIAPIIGLAFAVGTLAAAGTAGAIGLLAIGAAAFLIGAGIGLAATGMANLVASFSTFTEQGVEAMMVFTGLVGVLGLLVPLLAAIGPTALISAMALAALSALDLSMTSDIEATRVVKDTIVAATAVTPDTATNVEAVTDQIIRLHADTANAGNNTVLQTIKEVFVGATGGAAPAAAAAAAPVNVVLEVDGREIGRAVMPAINKRFRASVKAD